MSAPEIDPAHEPRHEAEDAPPLRGGETHRYRQSTKRAGALGWLVSGMASCALLLTGYHADPYLVFTEAPEVYVSDWEPNQSFVKTQHLHDVRETRTRPDAFVFGDSSAGAFRTDILEDTFGEGLRFYNYSVSGESVQGIRAKIRFLRRSGYRLEVVLVVGLGFWTGPSYLRREHFRVSGETRAQFYAYYQTFPFQGLEEAVLRTLRRWIAPGLSPSREYRFRTGDVYYREQDAAIRALGDRYHESFHPALVLESRRTLTQPASWSLSAAQRQEVRSLGAALREAGVSRTYLLLHGGWSAQIPDEATVAFLCEEFSQVLVLPGTSPQSRDYRNYYDPTHYRPSLARWMLDGLVEDDATVEAREDRRVCPLREGAHGAAHRLSGPKRAVSNAPSRG